VAKAVEKRNRSDFVGGGFFAYILFFILILKKRRIFIQPIIKEKALNLENLVMVH
jgi:diacylglycerol kinase family enzyme